jgi:hypothetical protein
MLATVEFNDESTLVAGEIRKVGTNRHLPPELEPNQATIPQKVPKPGLRVRLIPAQRPGSIGGS